MTATRVAELRRLVAEAETNAGVEALIEAAREAVAAYDVFGESRLRLLYAIDRLEELVGRP